MSSCIALAESLEMFSIVKLTLFFLLITQASSKPSTNFNALKRVSALYHRIWEDTYTLDSDPRTSVDFINGTTVVTATIGGQKYSATFPGEQVVTTEYYLITKKGTLVEKAAISVGDRTYIYKTKNGQTKVKVTDDEGNRVRDGDVDPFHALTNNIVSTTTKPKSNKANRLSRLFA